MTLQPVPAGFSGGVPASGHHPSWARPIPPVPVRPPHLHPVDHARLCGVLWGQDPGQFVPQPQDWWQAVPAIYSVFNGEIWHGMDQDPALVAPRSQMLAVAWRVTSRATMLSAVSDLLSQGHRGAFSREQADWSAMDPLEAARFEAELLTYGENSREELWRLRRMRADDERARSIDFTAWDMVRLSMLARAGFGVGYLSWPEAQDVQILAAHEIRRRFVGWADLYDHFLRGRWYWQSAGGAAGYADLDRWRWWAQVCCAPEVGPLALIPWQLELPQASGALVAALVQEDLIGPLTPAELALGVTSWRADIEGTIRQWWGLPTVLDSLAGEALLLLDADLSPPDRVMVPDPAPPSPAGLFPLLQGPSGAEAPLPSPVPGASFDLDAGGTVFDAEVPWRRPSPMLHPPGAVPPRELWLMALSAPYCEAAVMYHDVFELALMPYDGPTQERIDRLIADEGTDLVGAMTRIEQYGLRGLLAPLHHYLMGIAAQGRQPSSAELKAVADTTADPAMTWARLERMASDWPRFRRVTGLAVDLAAHGYLCRLASAGGLLSPGEARDRLTRFAGAAHGRYQGWADYADDWAGAAHLRDAGASMISTRAVVRSLLSPGGPWHQIPWHGGQH
ncbi:hypothetical protein KEM60_02025 [Austwickia sp. TVS 96-490-7B]|uniref:YbeU/YbeR family protein n=1 Tax=Austwickia sp. TVS 96-490-7B TaxID=2830843 RepID=UPI001C565106|nr:YbeU/YbeR family protein [Austwickia sp. TVS 96-490-7B]MBW3085814.1 hypothetical protein [Austwickia sp. TVS 96-490-7B]